MTGAVGVEEARAQTAPGVSYALARLHQRVLAGISERVRPHGLTTPQFTTLSGLSRNGAPLSTSQLARRALVTPQSMSEVTHALERKGLIKRNPDPNHRRILPATLTAKGRRVLAACEEAVSGFEDTMLQGFSEKDRAVLLGMVTEAVRNLGGGFPSDETSSSGRET